MSYGILHTDVSYTEPHRYPITEEWDRYAISYLKGQESQLYNMLGQNTFTGFMNEIHRLLDEAGNVRDILQRFKKGNLVSYFDLPKQLTLMDQEIHIRFNKVKGVDLNKLFLQLNGINGITVNPNAGTLDFIYNERSIKSLMNELEEREGRNRFDPSSKSMAKANQAFKDWLNIMIATDALGTFQINSQSTNVDLKTNVSTKAKDLFGFTQKEIEQAIYENPQLLQQLIAVRQKVYDELYNLCEGSSELQSAFDNVWTQKMGSIHSTNPTALMNFVFLSKGKNLEKGVSGAIQEMYGALLTEYLTLLSKKQLPVGLVQIMGNIAEGGEQPKADLTILDQIGIQVKAYGMNNQIKHMESNLHPDALDAQLQPYGAVNVGDAIVQSIFNTDNESPETISTFLRDYAGALLNLATSKELKVTSTVCFYLIDAQYLVPGSEILKAFDEKISDYKVKITSSFNGKGTEEYKDLAYKSNNAYQYKKRNTTRLSPAFMEYFDKPGTDEIHPDDKNKKWYESLYTSRISIRIIFDYGFVGNSNIYNIF